MSDKTNNIMINTINIISNPQAQKNDVKTNKIIKKNTKNQEKLKILNIKDNLSHIKSSENKRTQEKVPKSDKKTLDHFSFDYNTTFKKNPNYSLNNKNGSTHSSSPIYTVKINLFENNNHKFPPAKINPLPKQSYNSALPINKRNKNIVSKISDCKSHHVYKPQNIPNNINVIKNIKLTSNKTKKSDLNIKTNNDHSMNIHSSKLTINSPSSSNFNNPSVNQQSSEDTSHNNILKISNSVKNFTHKLNFGFSYMEDQNSEFRDDMQDMSKIIDSFANDPSKQLFCLYDGHGSGDVAKFAKERFPDILAAQLFKPKNNQTEKALTNAFTKLDEEIKKEVSSENAGSTACICYVTIESNKKVLYTANVGDTRAVLLTKSGVKRLSYDHKCSDVVEEQRVKNSGGMIFNGRVYGQLILSRALGDHSLKKFGVISKPHINKHFINESDLYVIIASDGVWDVIKDEDLVNIFSNNCTLDTNQLASLIVNTSLKLESKDNISCILIKLN